MVGTGSCSVPSMWQSLCCSTRHYARCAALQGTMLGVLLYKALCSVCCSTRHYARCAALQGTMLGVLLYKALCSVCCSTRHYARCAALQSTMLGALLYKALCSVCCSMAVTKYGRPWRSNLITLVSVFVPHSCGLLCYAVHVYMCEQGGMNRQVCRRYV